MYITYNWIIKLLKNKKMIVGYLLLLIFFIPFIFLFQFNSSDTVGYDRFQLDRDDLSNWLVDDLYHMNLETHGQSYIVEENHLYTYGYTGFYSIDLESGEIRLYIPPDSKFGLDQNQVQRSNLIRDEEGINSKYMYILEDESLLTEYERNIYNQLRKEKMIYPNLKIKIKGDLKP